MLVSFLAASPVVILLSGATNGGGPLVRVSGASCFHSSAGRTGRAVATDTDATCAAGGVAVDDVAGATGSSPRSRRPNGHKRTSTPFGHAPVDRRDLFDELETDRMLEFEHPIEIPVEVVTHVRDLLEQTLGRVRQNSPGRSPATSTSKSVPHDGQVTAAWVWPSELIRR